MAPHQGLRLLLLVVPASASIVAAYALLGPGARRDVRAARVYAAPSVDGEVRSGRVMLAVSTGTKETPVAGPVTVSIGRARADVVVGDDGAGDWTLDAPASVGDIVTVREGDIVLASAPLAAPPRAEEDDATDHVLDLGEWGTSSGDLVVRPRVLRGSLVSQFASEVMIEIRDKRGEPVVAKLSVDVVGGECGACDKPIERSSSARLWITPSLEIVSVTADAITEDGKKGHGSAEIPVRMGGLFLSRDGANEARVSAASKRRRAYASFFQGGARVGGGSAPLAEDADGRFSAAIPRPPGADLAVLTTDAEEAGASTVWSLAPDDASKRHVAAPRLSRAADGFPELMARETRRIGLVHRILFGSVGALAILEIALLGLVARRTRRELTTHFEEAREDEDIVLRPAPPIEPARSSAVLILTVGLGVVIASAAMVGLAFVRG